MADMIQNRRRLIAAAPHLVTAQNASSVLITQPKIERLAVTFAPVQAGSGTPSPSNVRAISGWSEIPVWFTPGADDILSAVPAGKYGTIDLSTGIMTVTHKCLTLTGSESNALWSWKGYTLAVSDAVNSNTGVNVTLCSHTTRLISGSWFFTSSSSSPMSENDYVACADSSGPQLRFRNWYVAQDLTSMQTYLQGEYTKGTPVQIVYPLATSETVQLSGLVQGTGTVTVKPFQYGGGTTSYTNVRPIVPVVDGPSALLGSTYYGGAVDLVSGTMTVTYGAYTVTSSTTIGGNDEGSFLYINMASIMPMKHSTGAAHPIGYSDKFECSESRTKEKTLCGFGSYSGGTYYHYIYIWDIAKTYPSITGKTAAIAKVKELAPTFVYEIQNPITVTLSPQTIAALRGQQTVFSPAGSVDITYWSNKDI